MCPYQRLASAILLNAMSLKWLTNWLWCRFHFNLSHSSQSEQNRVCTVDCAALIQHLLSRSYTLRVKLDSVSVE